MIWRLRIGRWRFTVTMARVADIIGVNSLLPDGNHILMWDFDDVDFVTVRNELERVQRTYNLPDIYILETKPEHNFIAYCFRKVSWRKAIEIMAYTQHICLAHMKYGLFRDKFTLRVSKKSGRKPRLRHVIKSPVREDAFVHDLRSWVKYETLEDGQEVKIRELRLPL